MYYGTSYGQLSSYQFLYRCMAINSRYPRVLFILSIPPCATYRYILAARVYEIVVISFITPKTKLYTQFSQKSRDV